MTHEPESVTDISPDAAVPPLPPRPLAPDVPDTVAHETRVTRVELGSFLRTVAPIAVALAILWLGARSLFDLAAGPFRVPHGGVSPGPMRGVIGVPIGAFLATLGAGLLLNGALRLTGGMRLRVKSRRPLRSGWYELIGVNLLSALKVSAGCAFTFLVLAVLRPPLLGGVGVGRLVGSPGWYRQLIRAVFYAGLVGLSMLVAALMYGWLARSWGGLSIGCQNGADGPGPSPAVARVEVWRLGFLEVAITSAVVPLIFVTADSLQFSPVPTTSGDPRMIPVALVLTVVLGFGVGTCVVGVYNLITLATGGLIVDMAYAGPREPSEPDEDA